MTVTPAVWVAYHPDRSDVRVFEQEIQALRYAVDHSPMSVRRASFGESLIYDEPLR